MRIRCISGWHSAAPHVAMCALQYALFGVLFQYAYCAYLHIVFPLYSLYFPVNKRKKKVKLGPFR